ERLTAGLPDGDLRPIATAEFGPGVEAASYVLADLTAQGWQVCVSADEVRVRPPDAEPDAEVEKDRVRRQELLKRDEQLRQPSTRRFVAEMERPREHLGSFVSIFSLMRDGRELADALIGVRDDTEQPGRWRAAIDPY